MRLAARGETAVAGASARFGAAGVPLSGLPVDPVGNCLGCRQAPKQWAAASMAVAALRRGPLRNRRSAGWYIPCPLRSGVNRMGPALSRAGGEMTRVRGRIAAASGTDLAAPADGKL